MITGEIKSQIDRVWATIWAGGISNPLEVVEQLTYLLFLRRLDEMQTLEENKAARLTSQLSAISSRTAMTQRVVATKTCVGAGLKT